MSSLFMLSNMVVLPFWGLLIFAPHWQWTARLAKWHAGPLLYALGYVLLLLPKLGDALAFYGQNPGLPETMQLLAQPETVVLLWLHVVAFDLAVGNWIYLDARSRQLSVWVCGAVLFVTLLFGPLGFLLYQLLVRLMPSGQLRDA